MWRSVCTTLPGLSDKLSARRMQRQPATLARSTTDAKMHAHIHAQPFIHPTPTQPPRVDSPFQEFPMFHCMVGARMQTNLEELMDAHEVAAALFKEYAADESSGCVSGAGRLPAVRPCTHSICTHMHTYTCSHTHVLTHKRTRTHVHTIQSPWLPCRLTALTAEQTTWRRWPTCSCGAEGGGRPLRA